MTKNTIKKVFHKDFVQNIWKIEVNGYAQELGIETRDQTTTMPTFHILNFETGELQMVYTPDAKDWALEGVQKDFLILKKVGDQRPTKAGIQVIRISTTEVVYTDYGNELVDVFEDHLYVRPRSVTQGGESLLAIATGLPTTRSVMTATLPRNRVIYPVPYPKLPEFLQYEAITGEACVSRLTPDSFAWAYHTKTADGYTLHLITTSLSTILSREVVQKHLPKMFLQPYFQVDRQIFFMADNNHEIVSYLV